MSSAEAEYVAGCNAALEVVYLRRILSDLGELQDSPTVIFQDNQPAIAIALNPVSHRKTKHIDVRVHKIRELIAEGVVQPQYVETSMNCADVFTKPLGPVKHATAVDMLLNNPKSEGEC